MDDDHPPVPRTLAAMTSGPRSTGADDRDANLTGFIIVTVLLPIVGIVAGIGYLFRNQIGPGLGLIAMAVVLSAVYYGILTALLL